MSDQTLENKTAIVTGGSRGIGRAITEALLREGASVLVCGRNQQHVDETLSELRAGDKLHGIAADVSNAAEVSKLFDSADQNLGGLDILVNNAGLGIFGSVADLTIEDWGRTLDT